MYKENFTIDKKTMTVLRIILLVIYIILIGLLIHVKAHDYNMHLEYNSVNVPSTIQQEQEQNEHRIALAATGVGP